MSKLMFKCIYIYIESSTSKKLLRITIDNKLNSICIEASRKLDALESTWIYLKEAFL